MQERTLKITKDFVGTQKNPFKFLGWDIWRKENYLFCWCSVKRGLPFTKRFRFEDGILHFVNGKYQAFCYMRTDEYLEFLKTYRIDKLVNDDPNRCYRTKNVCNGYNYNKLVIITDGKISNVVPLLHDKSNMETVTNATWTLEKSIIAHEGIITYETILYTTMTWKKLDLSKLEHHYII